MILELEKIKMNRIYHYLWLYAYIPCQSKSTVIVVLGAMSLKLQNAEDTWWGKTAYMTWKKGRDSVQHYHGEVGDDGSIKEGTSLENTVFRTSENSLTFMASFTMNSKITYIKIWEPTLKRANVEYTESQSSLHQLCRTSRQLDSRKTRL